MAEAPEPVGAPEVFHLPVPAPKTRGKVKPINKEKDRSSWVKGSGTPIKG